MHSYLSGTLCVRTDRIQTFSPRFLQSMVFRVTQKYYFNKVVTTMFLHTFEDMCAKCPRSWLCNWQCNHSSRAHCPSVALLGAMILEKEGFIGSERARVDDFVESGFYWERAGYKFCS